MNNLKNNIYLKVGIIIALALLLLLPTVMIKGLIKERESTQEEAIGEVSSKWGNEQTLIGPVLTIPFYKHEKEYSKKDATFKVVKIKDYIHILPDELDIDSQLEPEKRYRGVYEVVVYNSQMNFKGVFDPTQVNELDIPESQIMFDRAFISLGIDDLNGIENQISINCNGKSYSFNPGTVTNDIFSSGINAKFPLSKDNISPFTFNFKLDLKGSQKLHFSPVGKVTNINMTSNWSNPSFNGAFLPDTRKIDENGFNANWNILHLNRNYPQAWIGSNQEIESSGFGVDLILPVDSYQKSMRTVKYALLFIVLTFMVFFFVEISRGSNIHPIQYSLVGLALVLFYTLLLSISEHINFNSAYIISTISTLLMISAYVHAILRSIKISSLIGGFLLILYGFIFIIIQLQSFSLLIGSVGLFAILGAVMYFSRKIDWYNLKKEKE
jgi:inner membrane protein